MDAFMLRFELMQQPVACGVQPLACLARRVTKFNSLVKQLFAAGKAQQSIQARQTSRDVR